jgi:hypothetical protein
VGFDGAGEGSAVAGAPLLGCRREVGEISLALDRNSAAVISPYVPFHHVSIWSVRSYMDSRDVILAF